MSAKVDRRFLKAVAELGAGDFNEAEGLATDGHSILSAHKFEHHEGSTGKRKLVGAPEAKEMAAQVKAWKVETVILDPEGLLPEGHSVTDAQLQNMWNAYSGVPVARFCVDWKLMDKAQKILMASAKASERQPIMCEISPYRYPDKNVMFYRMWLRGHEDVHVYIAGMLEQAPELDQEHDACQPELESAAETCEVGSDG